MNERPTDLLIENPTFEFQVGGSLPLGAVSYVKRQADEELYKELKEGRFCYVLNSRQMGKSSLRVQTMERLQTEDIVCVAIDMTAIGSGEVTVEQWYLGIVWETLKQVREQTDQLKVWNLPKLRAWWQERKDLSVVQRWGEFIREVLLEEVLQQIVVFVDEIDSVLGLSFKADDFFAAIRELHNRRVDELSYERLTFALFGVCAPQDLIQDRRRTPFNIGKGIELRGFTYEEALFISQGIPNGKTTLKEILNWTGGQPFLTQRVCRLVVDKNSEIKDSCDTIDVADVISEYIIKTWNSNDEQVHFQTIQDRMMADESLAGAKLGLYQQILIDGYIEFDNQPEYIALLLTGAVVKKEGNLFVSNKIYESIFNKEWVAGKLETLRPYGPTLQKWVDSGKESDLLRGDNLRKARLWMGEENRRLAPKDYQYLLASDRVQSEELLEQAGQLYQQIYSVYQGRLGDRQQNYYKMQSQSKTIQKKSGSFEADLESLQNNLEILQHSKMSQRGKKQAQQEIENINSSVELMKKKWEHIRQYLKDSQEIFLEPNLDNTPKGEIAIDEKLVSGIVIGVFSTLFFAVIIALAVIYYQITHGSK
jgi:hypothetical protein